MVQFSSSEVREFLEKYDALMDTIAEYAKLKYDLNIYTSDLAIEYKSSYSSEFNVIDISTFDRYNNEGPETYRIPFSIFDAWANVVGELIEKKKKAEKLKQEKLINWEKEEYVRLKAKFEK